MDRNNGRYTYIRRQGQQQNQNQQHQQHQSTSSLSSSSSSSLSSTSNNNQHLDNHRNSSASSSASSQFSSSTNTTNTTSAYSSQSAMSREPLTQHDELIRYIREAWTKVSEQGTPVVYRNESDQLKNFKPFNLEEYWGQRLVQNIHVSHGHQ